MSVPQDSEPSPADLNPVRYKRREALVNAVPASTYQPRIPPADMTSHGPAPLMGGTGSWRFEEELVGDWVDNYLKKQKHGKGVGAEMTYANFNYVGTSLGYDVMCGRSCKEKYPGTDIFREALFLRPTRDRGNGHAPAVWCPGPSLGSSLLPFTGCDEVMEWDLVDFNDDVISRIPAVEGSSIEQLCKAPEGSLHKWRGVHALMVEGALLSKTEEVENHQRFADDDISRKAGRPGSIEGVGGEGGVGYDDDEAFTKMEKYLAWTAIRR
ncbi:unnamed protein product [Zymoseptoria tritici ST99CH_1E4]|uniref:Uncharacterized protein n=1 Tax=Zymoseptoria tritici ST99CH_1E4 TaxID=1276532 RepID=A0A2H1G4I6_ZYMTR|nr:unnamed protein product [Zymoseptoria tritici ST99CH_1E4]